MITCCVIRNIWLLFFQPLFVNCLGQVAIRTARLLQDMGAKPRLATIQLTALNFENVKILITNKIVEKNNILTICFNLFFFGTCIALKMTPLLLLVIEAEHKVVSLFLNRFYGIGC